MPTSTISIHHRSGRPVRLTRSGGWAIVAAGMVLMACAGQEGVRPKWGIYRRLDSQEYLRDEQVRFDGFGLAKGDDDCP